MKELLTPVGIFTISINGKTFDFEALSKEQGMYINDTETFPDARFWIPIDILKLRKGDVIVGRITGAKMECDCGDEHLSNMVGQGEEYTYGLGTIDDSDYGENCIGLDVPFQLSKILDDGYEITITDEPAGYPKLQDQYALHFEIAWIEEVSDQAWELISFVTC